MSNFTIPSAEELEREGTGGREGSPGQIRYEDSLSDNTPSEEIQRHLLNNVEATARPLVATLQPLFTIDGEENQVVNYDALPGGDLELPTFSIVKGSELGIEESSANFLNITVPEVTKRFVDLPDALRRSLVPIVKIYKTYIGEDGEQIDLRIRTDPYGNGLNRVELERVDFTRLGGNPAEVDTNIKFNIKLSARELGFYFKKQYPASEQGNNDLFTLERESRGVAWIDLIKIDPGRELQIGETGNDELVLNETDARMKVMLGYAEPTIKPSGIDDETWELWKETITSQQEIFYLNLFKHQFDFKSSGEVGLSMDFVASGNGRMLVPSADILLGPRYKKRLSEIDRDIKSAKKRIKDLPIVDEDIPESDYRTCVEDLQAAASGSMEGLERQREHLLSLSRRRLLNQLELGSNAPTTHPSAVGDDRYVRNDPMISRLKQVAFNDVSTTAVYQSYSHMNNAASTYVYLGDIVEAAIELLAHNGLLGEGKNPDDVSNSNESSYLHSWASPNGFGQGRKFLYPFSSFPPTDSRRIRTVEEYGGIIFGNIQFQVPDDGTKKEYSLLRLPISYKLFESWWRNKNSNKTSFYFKDFINSLLTDFVTTHVFSDAVYEVEGEEEEIERPEFSIGIAMLPSSTVKTMITGSSESISSDVYETRINDAPPSDEAFDLSSVMIIQQVRNSNATVTQGTPNLLWGQSTRGILERVEFQREDIPGFSESRLMSDRSSTSNNMILKEKYNTSIEMIGNTVFLPGSQLMLNPSPLDLGFTGEQGSLARSLGMGGLYTVNYIDNQIDLIKKSWTTKLDTKWESYGDGEAGDSTTTSFCLDAEGQELSRESTRAQRNRQAIYNYELSRAPDWLKTHVRHGGRLHDFDNITRELPWELPNWQIPEGIVEEEPEESQ